MRLAFQDTVKYAILMRLATEEALIGAINNARGNTQK